MCVVLPFAVEPATRGSGSTVVRPRTYGDGGPRTARELTSWAPGPYQSMSNEGGIDQ